MPGIYAGSVLRQVTLGQAQDAEPVAAQATNHERIRIMLVWGLRSEVRGWNPRQQSQSRRAAPEHAMIGSAEQERIEAGRRVTGKVHATSRVGAFVHNGDLPSPAREFQGRSFLGIIHRFGGGLGFWFSGFGLFFWFGHKTH